MCCKVSKSKHIHVQNRARAWHPSLIAALLKLIQNIQTHERNNDCIGEQVRNSSVLAVSAPLRLTVDQSLDVGYHLKKMNLHSASSTVLYLPFPPRRCFWLDCVQWPPGGNRSLLLRSPLHLRSSDALPGSVHLHADTRQFRDRNRYVCHVHGHEIPHLPPASLPRLVAGPRQPVPDQLALLPPLLWNLRRLLSVLHDLGGRPVPPTHPPSLHQRLHGIDAPQPQPPQPKWCGWGRREPQQLPH